MKTLKKLSLLQKRRWRIRKKINGTAERPRLAVHFSNKNITAQCIDDEKGHTLVHVSSIKSSELKANTESAKTLGLSVAEKQEQLELKRLFLTVLAAYITVALNHLRMQRERED